MPHIENKEIINQLYNEYSDHVFHFVYYKVRNKALAEDITQDTFIKAYKNINTLHTISKAKSWLFSIARNLVIDHVRRESLLKIISIPINIIKSPTESPESEHDKKERNKELFCALYKLKPIYRDIIYLRFIEELSIKETAEVLNIKESKVRVDQHRGIKELKLILNKEGEIFENVK